MALKENTMLYLTDFPIISKISDQDIIKFLSSFSESILQVKEEKKNHKPLSYKVIFKDYASANKCRLDMNLKKLKNKSIRIMWDEHDSSILYNTKNNLFFKGIPKNISPRIVYEYFLQFGDISSCKMTEDENGNHYGYGYVTFYQTKDAQNALDNTRDKKIEVFENNIIEISFFQKKIERMLKSNEISDINKQKLYISNLPENFSTNDLNALCKEYGSVQSCNIFIDNFNKNFGIVQFSSEKEAQEVLNKLDGKEIEGLKLNVKLYQTKQQREINHGCNLHIRNIPLNAKEQDLTKIFSKYGKIISARIEMYKKENDLISKGFGYVSFDNAESAEKAMGDLNGKYLPGFESWSRTLIIEPFLSRKERLMAENYGNIENNNEFIINYFSSNQDMNNHNKINDFNNIGNILPQQTMFNFNNINININQYNNNTQYINNNINSNININNNQFNLIRQYPNAVINYNQFANFNYQYQNNNQYRNYNNNHGNYRRGRGRREGGWQKKNYRNRQYQNTEEEINDKNKIDRIAFNKLKTIEEKREFLGEIIFKMIEENEIIKYKNISKETVGKITGMIIELPSINEVVEVAENNDILNDRIEEALNLLAEQKK